MQSPSKLISLWLAAVAMTTHTLTSVHGRPAYPAFRFVDYATLSPQNQVNVYYSALALEYDEASWNLPGTNPIEDDTFATIATTDSVNSVLYMGFSPDVWDCWMNHYMGYTWTEIVDAGLDTSATMLGYSEMTWGMSDPTATFDKSWTMLSPDEKMAASEFCYIQELWDAQPIDEWVASMPPTSFPTEAPSEDTTDRDDTGGGVIAVPPCEDPTTCTSGSQCCSGTCGITPNADGFRFCRKTPPPVDPTKVRLSRGQNRGGAAGRFNGPGVPIGRPP